MTKKLMPYGSVRYFAIFILGLSLLACNREVPSEFSELALKEIFVNEYGNEVKFGSILDSFKGRTIIIDVWASWCGDCIKKPAGSKSPPGAIFGGGIFVFVRR